MKKNKYNKVIINIFFIFIIAMAYAQDWAKDAIWYQIFPDRFYNGDITNDPTVESLWGVWPWEHQNWWEVSPWTSDWYELQPWEVDRFMLKLKITYPNKKEEQEILKRMARLNKTESITPVIKTEQILKAREIVDQIYLDEKLEGYIVDIVMATREPEAYKLDAKRYIDYGASPRATINLTLASKAYAFLQGRGYVTPQDIKSIGMDVLRHRVIVTYEAEADNIASEDIVNQVFDTVVVP